MTRTPFSRSKGQRSRSPGPFAHRRVGASGGCSGGRENVLALGNCCYVAVCSAAEGASAPTGEERGGAYLGGRPPTPCFQLSVCLCLGDNTVLRATDINDRHRIYRVNSQYVGEGQGCHQSERIGGIEGRNFGVGE